MKLTTEQLEKLAERLVVDAELQGVLLLLIHPGDRAELVAAFRERFDDLPGIVRRLADEVASGSGMPLGRNGQTMPGDVRIEE